MMIVSAGDKRWRNEREDKRTANRKDGGRAVPAGRVRLPAVMEKLFALVFRIACCLLG